MLHSCSISLMAFSITSSAASKTACAAISGDSPSWHNAPKALKEAPASPNEASPSTISASAKVAAAPPNAAARPARSGPTLKPCGSLVMALSPPIPTLRIWKERTAVGYLPIMAPFFAKSGSPLSQKAISVVVPPTSSEIHLPSSAAPSASMPKTLAAGPVNTASTGCLSAASKGSVPPSAFKICTGAVILRSFSAHSTCLPKASKVLSTAAAKYALLVRRIKFSSPLSSEPKNTFLYPLFFNSCASTYSFSGLRTANLPLTAAACTPEGLSKSP